MNKNTLTIFAIIALFVLSSIGIGTAFHIGIGRPPIRYAQIPEGTKLKLRKIFGVDDGHSVTIIMDGPTNWDNVDDFGSTDKWDKEEDKNFIVYYHKDKDATWQGHAQAILKAANNNIDRLTELMGSYFYPRDMNGRKLPIYLTRTAKEYHQTNSALGCAQTMEGSLGLTITCIGNLGCKTVGITLNPKCFQDAPTGPNGYIKVLMHEMNHYVYRSSIDYTKDIGIYNWMIEGIAEYCCDRSDHEKIGDPARIEHIEKDCFLDKDFPTERNEQYWAGESFFLYTESMYGEKLIREFLKNSYTAVKDSVFISFPNKEKDEHYKWVQYLKGESSEPSLSEAIPNLE